MEWKLFTDNEIPKYTTASWYASRERAPHLEQYGHRDRLLVTSCRVYDLFRAHNFANVVDLGCGDGGLLSLLNVPAWGYDLSPEAVRAAVDERDVDARLANVVDDQIDWADIAVATEMLEHLVDPHAYVRKIAANAQSIIASSPVFETDQNHYEFHTWAWDAVGYRALIEQAGFTVSVHDIVGNAQIITGVKNA